MMTRKNARTHEEVEIEDMVYIWRDNEGWIGPSPVIEITEYEIAVRQNNRRKTASRNRVRQLRPLNEGAQGNEQSAVSAVSTKHRAPAMKFVETESEGDNVEAVIDNVATSPSSRDGPRRQLHPPRIKEVLVNFEEDKVGSINKELMADLDAELETLKEEPEAAIASGQPRTQGRPDPRDGEGIAALQDTVTIRGNEEGEKGLPAPADQPIANNDKGSRELSRHEKELRLITEERNKIIGTAHPLGRTRSETHSTRTGAHKDQDDNCVKNVSFATYKEGPDSSARIDEPTGAADGSSDARITKTGAVAAATGQLTQDERKRAFDKELSVREAKNAFRRVRREEIPTGANIIGSHVVYRRKDSGDAKARIVPWGHRDPARFDLRCDLPCLNPDTFRIVLSIAAEMKWRIAQMDAEAAFLQARGFLREIYVRPPKEAGEPGFMWLLLAAAYGLADSGRLWYRTNDDALVNIYNLTRSRYEPTVYFIKDAHGKLNFILGAGRQLTLLWD